MDHPAGWLAAMSVTGQTVLVIIRPAAADDVEAVYGVCLRTADDGRDATHLYPEPSLPGDVWAGPYLALEPAFAFVLTDDDGVAGYVLGALDTEDFEQRCERAWWPALRDRHPHPVDVPCGRRSAEQEARRLIHRPTHTPSSIIDRWPSHLHIDLLPRAQGGGWGRRLLGVLCDALHSAGSPAVHLGVSRTNTNAVAFYEHVGFELVVDAGRHGLVLGRALDQRF